MGLFSDRREASRSRQEPVVETRASSVPKVPKRGLARVKTGARLYDAGGSDRLTGNWPTMPLTADDVVRRNQRVLVARSREQAANNDHARSFLRMCSQNIVGPRGVQLQSQAKASDGKLDTEATAAIERSWHEWSRRVNCDVTGQLSLRGIQEALIKSAARDGEFFVQFVVGRDAGPWGFSLLLIDAQRCPVDLDEVSLPNGRFIRHGVEFNQFGRPLAYYFTTLKAEESDYSYGGRAFTRVPAGQIIHGFITDLIGQKRGLPWMATSLYRMQQLKAFEHAALVNAREAANKQGFLEWEEGYGPEAEDEEGNPVDVEIESEAGTYHELPAGLRFKAHDPQYPNGELAIFSKHTLRGISAGLGVAYNNLASDLEGVNFSSIRQGTLDEREHWKVLQEWLIEAFIEPVFDRWIRRALLSGRIKVNGQPLPAEKLDRWSEVSWQARRWDWIDPNADVKAAVAAKDNLLTSPSQIIRDRGQDPQTVWRDIARDIEDMRAAGIPEKIVMAVVSKKMEGSNGQGQTGKAGGAGNGSDSEGGGGDEGE